MMPTALGLINILLFIRMVGMRGHRLIIDVLSRCLFFARRLIARCYDLYYRIETESNEPFRSVAVCRDGIRYQPTPYWLIREIIKMIDLHEADVVFDLGCGKGRVVALFSRQNVHQVVGIEIDETLAHAAVQNLARVRGRRSPVSIRCENAADANYNTGTVFFLFNPFGVETLGIVLSRIGASLGPNPRRVKIVYYNPRHVELFRAAPWLDFSIWEKKLWLRKSKRVLLANSKALPGPNPTRG